MAFKEIEPNVWKPENPGDSIEGVLVNCIAKTQEVGARYFIETKPGEIRFVWGTAVLDDRMALVKVGQKIRITFKELKKNKRNQDLKIFKVEVDE